MVVSYCFSLQQFWPLPRLLSTQYKWEHPRIMCLLLFYSAIDMLHTGDNCLYAAHIFQVHHIAVTILFNVLWIDGIVLAHLLESLFCLNLLKGQKQNCVRIEQNFQQTKYLGTLQPQSLPMFHTCLCPQPNPGPTEVNIIVYNCV